MSVQVCNPHIINILLLIFYIGDRRYGWAPLGTTPSVIQDLKRSTGWSILPAFTIEGYIAYKIHHGSITMEIFNKFVMTEVLLNYAGGDGPRSVLVMDNVSSHHNADLTAMCYEADVLLAYLPPYSPDLNPIKTFFSILKHWICRHSNLIKSYTEETRGFAQFLYDTVGELANDVQHNAGNLFRLSGI